MSVANYDSFHNPDVALSGFLNTFENVINVLALITTVRIKKKNRSEWFDGKNAQNLYA